MEKEEILKNTSRLKSSNMYFTASQIIVSPFHFQKDLHQTVNVITALHKCNDLPETWKSDRIVLTAWELKNRTDLEERLQQRHRPAAVSQGDEFNVPADQETAVILSTLSSHTCICTHMHTHAHTKGQEL